MDEKSGGNILKRVAHADRQVAPGFGARSSVHKIHRVDESGSLWDNDTHRVIQASCNTMSRDHKKNRLVFVLVTFKRTYDLYENIVNGTEGREPRGYRSALRTHDTAPEFSQCC